jgi:hypothetical protein
MIPWHETLAAYQARLQALKFRPELWTALDDPELFTPFWLYVRVGFTGAADETLTLYTPAMRFDLVMESLNFAPAPSDPQNYLIRIIDIGRGRNWASVGQSDVTPNSPFIPLGALAGLDTQLNNGLRLAQPYYFPAGGKLEVSFTYSGGSPAQTRRTLIFRCKKVRDTEQPGPQKYHAETAVKHTC